MNGNLIFPLRTWLRGEAGTITVDASVLTTAACGLAIATAGTLSTATGSFSDYLEIELRHDPMHDTAGETRRVAGLPEGWYDGTSSVDQHQDQADVGNCITADGTVASLTLCTR